jgi:tetratricopeptide (TPR) repeat protein
VSDGAAGALERGRALVSLGRYAEALEALAPAIADEDTAVSALCASAQCALGLQDAAHAEQLAQEALRREPDSGWAMRLLALALLRQGSRGRKQAHEIALRALEAEPWSVEAHHVLTITQLQTRRRTSALKTAEDAVELDPEHPLAHYTMGVAYAHASGWREAAECHRRALELDPTMADAAVQLAEARRRMGRHSEAADAYLAAARADPTDPRGREGLGRMGARPVVHVAGFARWFAVLIVLGLVEHGSTGPGGLAAFFGVAIVAVLTVQTVLSWRTIRHLPPEAKGPVRVERRNIRLRWLELTGWAALVLAVWSAVTPSDTGGLTAAAGYAAYAVVALLVSRQLYVGPRDTMLANIEHRVAGLLRR